MVEGAGSGGDALAILHLTPSAFERENRET